MPKGYPALTVFHGTALIDEQAGRAKRAPVRRVKTRTVKVGVKEYTSYSLDELLEWESTNERVRPGKLYG